MNQHGICPTCKAHCYQPDHKCPPSYLCSLTNEPNAEWERVFAHSASDAAECYLDDLNLGIPHDLTADTRSVYVREKIDGVEKVHEYCVVTTLVPAYTAILMGHGGACVQ
jgi:hypothetical protein